MEFGGGSKMKDGKVAIVGDRNFLDYSYFKKVIDLYKDVWGISFIVSGGARGVDTLAERYAKENEISYTAFVAEWSKYGKGAGPIRNQKIIENCDVVIAFLVETSKGTKNSVELAKKLNKPILIINLSDRKEKE